MLFVSAVIAMIRFKSLQAKDRIIAILLILTFPQVIACFILFKNKYNNVYLIHWFSLVEFILLMYYYYLLFDKGLFRKISIILTTAGLLWFTGSFFFQKSLLHPLSFLLFESLAIIVVGLLYYLNLFLKKEASIMRVPSFWITITLLTYWTISYTHSGLLIFSDRVSIGFFKAFERLFLLIGILFYTSLGGILLAYKKFTKSYE